MRASEAKRCICSMFGALGPSAPSPFLLRVPMPSVTLPCPSGVLFTLACGPEPPTDPPAHAPGHIIALSPSKNGSSTPPMFSSTPVPAMEASPIARGSAAASCFTVFSDACTYIHPLPCVSAPSASMRASAHPGTLASVVMVNLPYAAPKWSLPSSACASSSVSIETGVSRRTRIKPSTMVPREATWSKRMFTPPKVLFRRPFRIVDACTVAPGCQITAAATAMHAASADPAASQRERWGKRGMGRFSCSVAITSCGRGEDAPARQERSCSAVGVGTDPTREPTARRFASSVASGPLAFVL